MKTSAMITMTAIVAGSAWAAGKSDGQRPVICLEDGKHAGVDSAAAAVWTPSDYTQMKRGQLFFTPLDVAMIHDCFAARAARNTGGAVVAAVAP
jgi:hypothetical protein